MQSTFHLVLINQSVYRLHEWKPSLPNEVQQMSEFKGTAYPRLNENVALQNCNPIPCAHVVLARVMLLFYTLCP